MTKQIERRNVDAEFRIVDDNGKPKIFGYAAKYGVRSSDLGGWTEVLAPTVFDKALKTNPDVHALFNHDENIVLGRTTAGTLRIKSDAVGLAYEIDPPDTQAARDLMTSMKRGDINKSSFGFICDNAQWTTDADTGMDVRTVTDAQLFDVSPVTFPAYPQATSGVRSALPTDMPVEVRTRVTKTNEQTRDLGEDDCECLCPECVAGDCADCSDPDCDDPNCDCNGDDSEFNSMNKTINDANDDANRSLRIRLMEISLKS